MCGYVKNRIECQTFGVCLRILKTTRKYNKTGNMNNKKNNGLRYGDLRENTIQELADDRLLETRSEFEIELYRLDREKTRLGGNECMPYSQSRTIRDVEIDRDYILSKIEELEHEMRERNLLLQSSNFTSFHAC